MINFLTIKILLHKNGYTEADVCVRRIEKNNNNNNKNKTTTTTTKKNKQNNTKKCKNSYEIYPEPVIDK